MAICEATGPRAIDCSAPSTVVAVAAPSNVWGTPCEMSKADRTIERGRRT